MKTNIEKLDAVKESLDMSENRRIQLKREKGWQKPKDAVSVSRPFKFGNPFSVVQIKGKEGRWLVQLVDPLDGGYITKFVSRDKEKAQRAAVRFYRSYLTDRLKLNPAFLDELQGKRVACWCGLDEPCHGDVIISELEKRGW